MLKWKNILMIGLAMLTVSSTSLAGVAMHEYESLPEEMEVATVIEAEPVIEEAEPIIEEEIIEEELEEEEIEEEPEEEEPELIEISLTGTSIERDLKIKIENQHKKLIAGEHFYITVTSAKDGKTIEYDDHDNDGIIYKKDMEAGDYTVTLNEFEKEGYLVKKGKITVTVKDKIEYEKVDVQAEIKTESQVNTKVEDTAINDIPVESTLKDTIPLLESKISTSKVEKKDVDMSNFTKAWANSKVNSQEIKLVITKVEAPEIPTPEEPGNNTGTGDNTETGEGDNTETGEGDNTETGEGDNTETGEDNDTITGDDDTAIPPTDLPTDSLEAPGTEQTSVAQRLWRKLDCIFTLRVKAAQTVPVTPDKKATISLPQDITLYHCDNEASNTYKLTLGMTGDISIIQSIKWENTDPSVVSLSSETGTEIKLQKNAKGSSELSAEVTYICDDKGTTATASVKTNVFVVDMDDRDTVLKDKSGNILYVDDQARTKATLKDYAVNSKFYRTPKYTGWQTIDGKVYYYDEEHEKVTGKQVIGGVVYNFSSDGSLLPSSGSRGIDVSKYQGNIDWNAVAASGIEFAIIRAGYRGSSTGVLVEDPYFKQNIRGATKAGIKVGVYFFTQAISEVEAVEEASMVMSLVSGYKLSYPIFIDTEAASNGRANGLSKNARTAIVKAFCQTVQNGGYKAGIYASKSWYSNQLNVSALSNYCIWVAQYNAECTYTGKYNMWQYTDKGKVTGISGNVDMNISYMQ